MKKAVKERAIKKTLIKNKGQFMDRSLTWPVSLKPIFQTHGHDKKGSHKAPTMEAE